LKGYGQKLRVEVKLA